ncbi:MAG: EscU/YscU/HrcU family type III secretion system export apparatus switch protein [Spirochaetota bacterium]
MEKAIALRYDETLPAPLIVAKGADHMAERIRNLAEESGVRIVSDPLLADSLERVEVGELIPYELYAAVAELLVFVRRMEEKSR